MAVINRFNSTIRGGLTIGGNTLGLGKAQGTFFPGFFDSIGGFVTVSTTIPTAAGWATIVNLANNENITLDFTGNSSTGNLDIPSGSTVEYAELFWAGVLINTSQGPPLDVSAFASLPVSLIPPGGSLMNISPSTVTAQQFASGSNTDYVRSQDITSIVKQFGQGAYTVGNVASAMSANDDSSNYAGWTILAAYSNPALNFRNLTIYAMGDAVNTMSTITLPVSGFITPVSGPVSARVLISVGEGDANKQGDEVLLQPPVGTPVTLSGPNNLPNNFFASQINNNDGLLDTRGTFGNRNQDPATSSDTFAGRQGWDVTNVDGSGAFTNNQTSTTLVLTTFSDGYDAVALGLQINSNEPLINPVKTVDLGIANVGDTLTYTISFQNLGDLPAFNGIFIDTIPNGTQFVPGSLIINGTPSLINPQNGITIGTIPINASYTITFKVNVTTVPNPNPIPNVGNLIYNFQPLPGAPTIVASPLTNIVTTTVPVVSLNLVKSVNENFARIGDTLTYNIQVTNTGNAAASNPVFFDTIPNGTVFVPPILVNGNPVAGNPQSGVTLPSNIGPGQSTTITFQVQIVSIPNPNPIPNFADISYVFSGIAGRKTSNTVFTTVNSADLSGIIKFVDKSYASCGDLLTYTVTLPNTGNVTANNVVFFDTIPNGTVFVPPVLVNGNPVGGNPTTGIFIGTILAGQSAVVKFQTRTNCV